MLPNRVSTGGIPLCIKSLPSVELPAAVDVDPGVAPAAPDVGVAVGVVPDVGVAVGVVPDVGVTVGVVPGVGVTVGVLPGTCVPTATVG
jgi:hypothetical protein